MTSQVRCFVSAYAPSTTNLSALGVGARRNLASTGAVRQALARGRRTLVMPANYELGGLLGPHFLVSGPTLRRFEEALDP